MDGRWGFLIGWMGMGVPGGIFGVWTVLGLERWDWG